jgi:hypothetical protein
MSRRLLSRIAGAYRSLAIILLNCFLLFIIANIVALPFVNLGFNPYDPRVHRDQWLARNGIEAVRRVYPGLSDREIDDLLLQAGQFGQVYEPYIATKSEPMMLEHTAFHTAGFRLIGKDQGPWPMSSKALNVFVFGGSTIVGSGVRDDQAIPAVLQKLLRAQAGTADINVYNFATAGHYSTQERIYFEQLILKGNVPAIAIFIDGLNDFFFWNDEPAHTATMRLAFQNMNNLTSPRGLGFAIKLTLLRLPVSQFLLPYYYYARTGQMPTAALIASAYAQTDPYDDHAKIKRVIGRYFRFKDMAEAVAQRFGVTPIFVWQPVPLYKFDPKLALFPVAGDHKYHRYGYPLMAEAVAKRNMTDDFIWCADAFASASHPLYLDSVHYTIEGNEIVADCVAQAIAQRGLLQSALRKLHE